MPQKQKSKSWTELKQSGNECFKTGQYGEATNIYSQAIKELEKSNKKEPEDLGILYSNRAASYLKDGNCAECVKDCNMSLELFPFNVKSLLRRAAAYEAVERYRQAYVDYKTALQIDCNIAAAHDGTNRMTKALTEADGLSWREKLPPIPTVPMSIREQLAQKASANAPKPNPTPKQNGTRQTNKPGEICVMLRAAEMCSSTNCVLQTLSLSVSRRSVEHRHGNGERHRTDGGGGGEEEEDRKPR
ncbi:mitochondrial import receptor subunit TOM34 [Cottoperca gobio]|uniref:Mitochondrial import receptor subunit TOM34 n=1 Tax=Cottoperca gobio TaxID=56716 RepID=A0A6J2PB55_COTGO|nr:mitochondrial import receptor subunit TOM34-like [Cottoperca gobio]